MNGETVDGVVLKCTVTRWWSPVKGKIASFVEVSRVNPMKSFIAILGLLLSLAGCYGPVEDHGEFISGIVSPDGTTLIFSYHTFVYRNARGLNAQPDGGKPWYLEDQISIGLYTFDTDEIQ